MNSLKEKSIIVTGAAGGMGKAIVAELLKNGSRVIALDKNINALKDIENSYLEIYEIDILDETKLTGIISEVYENYGKLDGLVNALGIAQSATPIDEVRLEDWEKIFDINVKSLFLTSKAVTPYMKEQKQGSIITIASISAVRPRSGLQAYIASKSAAEGFTRGLAIELAEYGIRVNTIHPGPTDTPMLGQFVAKGAKIEQAKEDLFKKSIPLGVLIEPEDIAQAVIFLLSDQANKITGATLKVDGGRGL